jgi:hypothetical protein
MQISWKKHHWNLKKLKENCNFLFQSLITLFGAIRREHEENKKDATAFQICLQNFQDVFGTIVMDVLANPTRDENCFFPPIID